MRHDKYAVFQITDREGMVRLVCVDGTTFADGVELERAFRAQASRHLHVIFLGRFDRIEMASGVPEFLDLTLGRNVAGGLLAQAPSRRPPLLGY